MILSARNQIKGKVVEVTKDASTQICGNDFMVLKVAPPLVVTEAQVDEFIFAIRSVVELAHSSSTFWSEAIGLARRAVNF